ncbi:hypothetical protein, partial [Pseudomonas aeruginosa]|uniref:hypothetical protein n=1 Tax=Pseudomonas aeruginosa TaxID=287 RepID=UPI003CEE1A94
MALAVLDAQLVVATAALLILAFFALVLVPAPFLGRYCFKVMEGQRNLLSAPLA